METTCDCVIYEQQSFGGSTYAGRRGAEAKALKALKALTLRYSYLSALVRDRLIVTAAAEALPSPGAPRLPWQRSALSWLRARWHWDLVAGFVPVLTTEA